MTAVITLQSQRSLLRTPGGRPTCSRRETPPPCSQASWCHFRLLGSAAANISRARFARSWAVSRSQARTWARNNSPLTWGSFTLTCRRKLTSQVWRSTRYSLDPRTKTPPTSTCSILKLLIRMQTWTSIKKVVWGSHQVKKWWKCWCLILAISSRRRWLEI